ncbi:Channel-forming transporter/cytolysins activator of TpsB family [Burkholderia anthina]|nr:Channel-forming transporter/cytolysins activator of TpsB family [Burkholderia anthina]
MAQSVPLVGNDQQARQQEEARERERTVSAPAVRSSVAASAGYPAPPAETPCFRIDRFTLDVPDSLPDGLKTQGASALPMDRFAFAREWLEHYTGQCVGKQGLDVFVKALSQDILSRGYITTRVLLPEQDLSTGTLNVSLIPGVIRRVRFADEKLRGTWKTAFPTRDGELNLRDLEQGLEQMKRVTSQDVSMQIVPADVPGESDVVLDVRSDLPLQDGGTRCEPVRAVRDRKAAVPIRDEHPRPIYRELAVLHRRFDDWQQVHRSRVRRRNDAGGGTRTLLAQ